jgi:hypothetical protein
MIPLKGQPDLTSRIKVRHRLKLRKRKAREDSITGLAICFVLVNLLLTNLSSKHYIIWILTNLPNPRAYAPEICRHADLPIQVVCSIEEWWLA